MTTMIRLNRVRAIAGGLLSLVLGASAIHAQAQGATITGKVASDAGQPIEQANVYINDLAISVGTNAQGVYTITIPEARVTCQQVNLRVRAIGPTGLRGPAAIKRFRVRAPITRR